MATVEMSCQELVELITEYLEDTLAPEARVRFEQHLGVCKGCLVYLEQMRRTIRSVGKLSEHEISVQAEDELLTAFRDWQKES